MNRKVELFALSVPIVCVAVGGIAYYGAWRTLWVLPVAMSLASLFRILRSLLVESLDGPRERACRKDRWWRAYALAWPIAAYDWFVMAALLDAIYLFISMRYRGEMPLPFVYCWVYVLSLALPRFVSLWQDRQESGAWSVTVEGERVLLVLAIVGSCFLDVTFGRFLVSSFVSGIVCVGWVIVLWYRGEKERFERARDAERLGRCSFGKRKKQWFPRQGVIYEPSEDVAPLLVRYGGNVWDEYQQMVTVCRITPMFWLMLLSLLIGAATLVDAGRSLTLLSAIPVWLVAFVSAAFVAENPNRRLLFSLANGAPRVFAYFALSALLIWLGSVSLESQLTVAAFLLGCFEFPLRYVVRIATVECPDWRNPLATAGALLVAIYVRRTEMAPWYVCALCSTAIVYPLILVHHLWPMKALRQEMKP